MGNCDEGTGLPAPDVLLGGGAGAAVGLCGGRGHRGGGPGGSFSSAHAGSPTPADQRKRGRSRRQPRSVPSATPPTHRRSWVPPRTCRPIRPAPWSTPPAGWSNFTATSTDLYVEHRQPADHLHAVRHRGRAPSTFRPPSSTARATKSPSRSSTRRGTSTWPATTTRCWTSSRPPESSCGRSTPEGGNPTGIFSVGTGRTSSWRSASCRTSRAVT